MRGRLITLEGGEGAGKSTLALVVRDWLAARGRRVRLTREPGGSPLAEAIRGLVLRDWAEGMDPTTEALLIFAARAAHLHATVRPALDAGEDVVSDRFVDASWAYQGAGRGLDPDVLAQLEHMVLADLRPDLTLVFDLPPEIGLPRALGRGEVNRFESETLAFMQRVRQAYLQRAALWPERYVVIDATQPIAAVQACVAQALNDRLGEPR